MASNWEVSPPTFDLETWASNYEGLLVPLRLAHVAIRCPSLRQASLSHALALAKNGKNTQLYSLLYQVAAHLNLQGIGDPDSEWITRQEELNKREQARLEGELRGYKNNLIRESIRMGQEDLAKFQLITGGPTPDPNNAQSMSSSGYTAAYQSFGKMRDYCTTPTHIASMTLHLAFTALVQAISTQLVGNSSSVHLGGMHANASRLRSVGVKEEEQAKLSPISSVMTGVAQLSLGNYREAAGAFIQTPFEYHTLGAVHGTDYSKTMASGNDVAIYGGLCALASLSRQELISSVLSGSFRQFLELEPHMRKAISLYTTAKYQSCIATLGHYYSDWSLDLFLGANTSTNNVAVSHLDRLLGKIREKSITAHFSSFSEASLASLAATFPPMSKSATAMEEEVLEMIEAGTLDARLDVVNGLLIAPQEDVRQATHSSAQATADEVERSLLLRLHKVNVTMAGLEIPKAKGSGGKGWESNNGLGMA